MKRLRIALQAGLMWLAATAAALPAQTSDLARAGSVVHLPGLTIHGGKEKFIEATGRIALTDGILEFIAVEPEGRDYESLLILHCRPSALQFALLLIGCEPGTSAHVARPGEKLGTALRMEVEWQSDGKAQRHPVEKLIINRRTGKPPAKLPWVFTGSHFVKNPVTEREEFLSDAEQAFIALVWQPGIVINLGGEHGDPYRGDDLGFEVNKAAVPPKGTPVKLILRPQD